MKKYNLTIISEKRSNASILIITFSIITSIFIGVWCQNILYGLPSLIFVFFSVRYFAIGHLTIEVTEDRLNFQWDKKAILKYKDIDPVNFDEIKTIVLDNGEFLRKIITSNRTIRINNSRISPKDAPKFIKDFTKAIKIYDIKIIDSWDLVNKPLLKVIYWSLIMISIIGGLILLISIILTGFHLQLLYMFPLIPLLYIKAIKIKPKI